MKIIIKGLPIKNLSPKVVFGAVNKGIRKSIIGLKASAIPETPIDKGFLKTAFRERFSDLRGELYNTAKYAKAVHDGTRPHLIKTRNKKALSNGKTFFGKVVHHPGTKANPFMDRAIKNFGGEKHIEKIILNELNKLYA